MSIQQELDILYQKALELRKEGKETESQVVEAQAAGIFQELQNRVEQKPEDPSTAEALLILAEHQWGILGDHEEVRTKLERALALCENHLGHNHPKTAEALAKLAEFHFLAGRSAESLPLYRRSLAIDESSKAAAGLAQTLASLGHAGEADPYFARAIELLRDDVESKRMLYLLLIYRAEGLEKLNRSTEAALLRQEGAALLPKSNPGEFGFQV